MDREKQDVRRQVDRDDPVESRGSVIQLFQPSHGFFLSAFVEGFKGSSKG
jgi:hypothetical protein